jgi:hypothetical protein
MDEAKLLAWRSHRQGLEGTLAKKEPAEILNRAGWARSVGGVGPYLTFFSRSGASREAVDEAVAKLEIHELPSARGCTYVVPASDFALALKLSQGTGESSDMRTARKLGVTDAEIEKLRSAILRALGKGPLSPEELRENTDGAARSLGPEGKKKGLITTLPIALGQLQSSGDIRRVPVNGRLDQQRYNYALWRPNPLAKFKLSTEEAQVELARLFFKWIGPATLGEFQWFSGLGVRASQAAVEPLKLAALPDSADLLMFPKDRDAFEDFQSPKRPNYKLVSGLDSLILLRRTILGLLAKEDLKRVVPGEQGQVEARTLTDLPSHAIFDRGRLVGLWEYDVETQAIVWLSFGIRDPALEKAVKQTEEYVREQLGDARSFSLDSPKSRVPRLEALRKAAKTS